MSEQQKEWFEGSDSDVPPIDANPWWLNVAIEVLCFACLGALLAIAVGRA